MSAAQEPTHAPVEQRSRRLKLSATALLVIFVTTVVFGTRAGGHHIPPAHSTATSITPAPTVPEQVSTLLSGIPQHGNALGPPNAPVTLVWFGDLECPFCKRFTLGAFSSLIATWVRPGRLRIEYRSMETATREPEVFAAQQIAALAAGEQNRMWGFIETFYREQGEEGSGYVTAEYLRNIASQTQGLNITQWIADRQNPELAASITTDALAVRRLHLRQTPAFLLGKTGHALTERSFDSLTQSTPYNEAIREALGT